MRLLTIIVCLVTCSFAAFAQTPASTDDEPEDLILGFRGKSKYQIVVPDAFADAAAESSVTRAAELVQQAFAANKITLPVVKESAMEATRPSFFIGATKFAAANGGEASGP